MLFSPQSPVDSPGQSCPTDQLVEPLPVPADCGVVQGFPKGPLKGPCQLFGTPSFKTFKIMFAIRPIADLLIQCHFWLLQITWYFTL